MTQSLYAQCTTLPPKLGYATAPVGNFRHRVKYGKIVPQNFIDFHNYAP